MYQFFAYFAFIFLLASNSVAIATPNDTVNINPATPCIATNCISSSSLYSKENYIQQSIKIKLYDEKLWKILLHYSSEYRKAKSKVRVPKGILSENGNSYKFFFATDGNKNPKHELTSDIEQIFNDFEAKEQDPEESFLCKFPARLKFISDKLHFQDNPVLLEKLNLVKCSSFKNWINDINPQKLTLVYADSYFNNPASLFGHSFLRIDSEGDSPLLAYAIQYGASLTGDPGILFALKGVFGGYFGFYNIEPYYLSIKRYNDIEERDLWEYELNIPKDKIIFLLSHLWELRNKPFDYYYFDENCSYQILALLDVIYPEKKLTKDLLPWVIPLDSIKAVLKRKDILKRAVYRESKGTEFEHKLESLNSDEKKAYTVLLKNKLISNSKFEDLNNSFFNKFSSLDNSSKVKILEVLALKFQKNKDLGGYYNVLKEASKYNVSASSNIREKDLQIKNDFTAKKIENSPHNSHNSVRLGFGAGYSTRDHAYTDFSIKPAYHSIEDPISGYRKGAYIDILSTDLKLFTDNKFKINYIKPFEILSLTSSKENQNFDLNSSLSWFLDSSFENSKFNRSFNKKTFAFQGGIGKSLNIDDKLSLFLLTGPRFELYDTKSQISADIYTGVIYDFFSDLRMILRTNYYLGNENSFFEEALLRYTIKKDFGIAITSKFHHIENDELVYGLNVYKYF